MTITVQTCPRCSALVMSDAAECHLCHYEFDRRRVDARTHNVLPSDPDVADDMDVCAKCGEKYRKGLLRCSSCGAFTRPEIELEYQRRMEAAGTWAPQSFDLPEYTESREFQSLDELDTAADDTPRDSNTDDADFELTVTDADFEFELAENVQLKEAAEGSTVPAATEGGYALRLPEPSTEAAPKPVLAPSFEETPPAPIPLLMPTPMAEAAETTQPAAKAPPAPPPSASAATTHSASTTHSAATSGDFLLDIARQEEADIQQAKRMIRQKLRGGFVVYCPMGCKIRVSERHRGRTGKCPRCGSPFFVPLKPFRKTEAETAEAAAPPPEPGVFGKWRGWMENVHLHAVVPQKLKIKADSLLKDFQAVDLAFSEDGLLLVTLVTAAGLFGANEKKKPAVRAAVQQHLATVGKLDGLPAPAQRLYPLESLKQFSMAQPTPPDVDSLFAGVPVFGTNRIAVKLPKLGDETAVHYLSFSLSEFREFTARLAAAGGPDNLGADTDVPLVDNYHTFKCHYTDQVVQELIGLPYYQADKSFSLQLSGWRCGKCGLVVSEDARKKEKIGGLNGKGIAKAVCPKCKGKFGNHPLYSLAAPAANPPTTPAVP
jgi:hypothetical protein